MTRLGVRTRLLIAVIGVLAVSLLIGLVAFDHLLSRRLSADATALARAQAQAQISTLAIEDGDIVTREAPDDATTGSQVWIFSTTRLIEAPAAATAVSAAARSLAEGPERSLDIGDRTRLYALPVEQGHTRYGTVVAAVSLGPYTQTRRVALAGASILAAVMLLVTTVVSRWTLRRALRPVARMTESAANWSATDPERRFKVAEPHDELTRLAATFDELLERIAATLRREQRLTAEISHELRTPLALISGEAELLMLRERTPDDYREAAATIARNAARMAYTIDTLLEAARDAPGGVSGSCDLRDAIANAVEALGPTSGKDVRTTLPESAIKVAVESDLVKRMLQPLLENAIRYSKIHVDIRAGDDGSRAFVDVVDDGPGVRNDEDTVIFQPGTRGSAAIGNPDGFGLGLPLARRLAQTAGGDIVVRAGATGGQFTLELPLA